MNALKGPPEASALSILIVEDNAPDIELLETCLGRCQARCEFEVVDSAIQLRERLADQHFDAVLCEFAMPAFSGPDALAIARQVAPETPFIFVSGMMGEEIAVDMLRCGATDYVSKHRLQRLPMAVERAVSEAAERRHRRRAETALREYEAGFRMLIDTLKDYAVIGLDREARIRSWNSAAENMLGYDTASILGQPGHLLYAGVAGDVEDPAPRFYAAIEAAQTSGSYSAEHWLHGLEGREFFASVVTTAIRDENGELIGFSKIIRDTTEARRSEEALRVAKEEAEAANSAKDQFLAALSHELRAPLTSILTAVEVVERGEDLRRYLPVIRRNVELEARLIDDLLDLTTVSRDRMEFDFRSVELHECLHNVISLSRTEVARKTLNLDLRLTAANTRIRADVARIQQVLWALLHNAIKFTPVGGSVIVETLNTNPDGLVLRISDSGRGIAAEALRRVFLGFGREDVGPGVGSPGSLGSLGIGLAIAHKLVAKHGGSLNAASDGVGQGATFVLTLPLESVALPAPDNRTIHVGEKFGVKHSLRILLVEDNPDTLMAMQALLEIQGNRVVTASTVAQAKRVAASSDFDLLIGDIGLPDGDGTEVVKAFNRVQRAPSIAVTGYGTREDRQKCTLAGFTAHLTKPVNFDRLTEMIQTVCDGARPPS